MSEEIKKDSEPTESNAETEKKVDEEKKVEEVVEEKKDDQEVVADSSNEPPKEEEKKAENKQEESKEIEKKSNADEVDIGLTIEDEDVDQLLNDELKVIDDSEAKVDVEKNDKTQKNESKKESTNKDDDASEKQAGRSLWVSGLSSATRANDLKKHFLTQGRVVGAKVVSNSRSPRARCYGYIVMSTAEEADQCVKNLHHSKLLNRFISVKKAKNEKGETIDTKPSDDDKKTKKSEENPPSTAKNDKDKPRSGSKKRDNERRRSREDNRKRDSKDRDRVSRTRTDSERERERLDRIRRMREERRLREKRMAEEKRLREAQIRQREEAIRLDREKQKLRLERERLQREKLELLRLEKEQLEKEREEIKRQKQKIEEANRRKKEAMARHPDRTKRHRERTPPRRSPDVPPKLKKHHDDKYKDERSDRHHKDLKYRDPKEFRSSYKTSEYRGMDAPKYDRYGDDKKPDEFMKGGNAMDFEPPPPRISSSEASHFSALPISHSGSFPSNRFRDDFHGKDMFSSVRNDRVSDRFPSDRHDRMPSDLDHRGRSGFPPIDSTRGGMSRIDSGRMGRDLLDPPRGNLNGRYPEGDRDMRHRDGWYGSGSNVPVQKRVISSSMPSHRGENWSKGNHGNLDSWDSGRHFDDNLRPPGVYGMDRMKNDRH